jgi:hypothetical protein
LSGLSLRSLVASDPEGPDALTDGSTRRHQHHPPMLISEEPDSPNQSINAYRRYDAELFTLLPKMKVLSDRQNA